MRTIDWRRNLAALWIAQALTMVGFNFVQPFFALYVQDMGVADTNAAAQWASYLAAASALSMCLTQPIWGNLSDSIGRRPMVIRSMLGGSITVAIMAFLTSPEQLLVVRFIQGTLTGTVVASNTLVATTTPKEHAGFALGLMQVAIFSGSSVGPLLGGLVADAFGFRASFIAAATLLLMGALMVVALVRENFVKPAAGTPKPGIWAQGRALWGLALFPTLIGVQFLTQFGGVIVSPVLSLFIAELSSSDNAATMAGMVLAVAGAVSAASAAVIGRVGDRLGHARILQVCLAGAAITYFPQTFVQNVWQLLALRMALGVFLGGLMPSANAMLVALVPRNKRGAAFGLSATSAAGAQAAGPLVTAVIVGSFSIRDVFLATSALFAVATVLAVARMRVVGSVNVEEQAVPQPEGTSRRLSE